MEFYFKKFPKHRPVIEEKMAFLREKGGTGLGLSIAHTIVKLHGGNIKITSNEPKGAKVIIKI